MHRLLLPALALLALATPARAAFTVAFAEVGGSVVAVGSGSLNTMGLAVRFDDPASTIRSFMTPSAPSLAMGLDFNVAYRAYEAFFTGSVPFGTRGFTVATLVDGGVAGFIPGFNQFFPANSLLVSAGYTSGSRIDSVLTFSNQTLDSLQLTRGTYTYSYSATQGGPILDTYTVQIGTGVVPEPSSIAMAASSLPVGLICWLRLRRRSAKAA